MRSTHQPDADAESLKAYYLDHFRRNRSAILDAAALGFDPAIKGCPGWDVGALTAHMGRVFAFWLKWVRERPRGLGPETWQELLAERDRRLPGYNAWETAGFPVESRPDGIGSFARETGEQLDAALVRLGPEETVWTFVPTQQNGAFIFRRLAMESVIHRWDAEDAHGTARPIDDAFARDGVDEMLMLFREDLEYENNSPRRHGQTVLLREEHGPGHWLVSFDAGGVTTSSAVGPADVTITGTASDLLLFIMGRRLPSEMQIDGDTELAGSWGDLAGRF
jgi:uncharacterized protein (TIGR03083 family)